jgi:hypothetical protein
MLRLAVFEEIFGVEQEENPERNLKAVNQNLNDGAYENDDVAPKNRLLRIVMDIDGGVAVYRQARNAGRRLAVLLKHVNFSNLLDGVLGNLLHDNCGRRRDCQLIIKLNRVDIIARRNTRVLEAEQKVVSHRVRAIIADDSIGRMTANVHALYKVHVLCSSRISQINFTTLLMFASLSGYL